MHTYTVRKWLRYKKEWMTWLETDNKHQAEMAYHRLLSYDIPAQMLKTAVIKRSDDHEKV